MNTAQIPIHKVAVGQAPSGVPDRRSIAAVALMILIAPWIELLWLLVRIHNP